MHFLKTCTYVLHVFHFSNRVSELRNFIFSSSNLRIKRYNNYLDKLSKTYKAENAIPVKKKS